MRWSLICRIVVLVMVLVLAACAAQGQGPMTWLDQPLDGATLPLEPVTVQAHASDADGVASIEFFIDETSLTTASADGGRLADAMVEWNPTEPGHYTVRARATDSQGNVGSDATSVVTVGLLPTPSATAPPAPDESEMLFFVEPEAIPVGGCAMLHWQVYPPVDALLDGEGVPSEGEREVCPETTRTYELLVPETGHTRTATLHVKPAPEMELAIFFAVDPDVIPAGGCAMLFWEVGAPEEWRVLIDGQEAPHLDEREECPSQTTTYELLVETPDGPQVRTVTLRVEAEPEPTPPPGCPGPPVISSFTANPSTITAGQSSTLSWGRVTNGNSDVLVRSVVMNPGLGEVGSPGSRVVQPATTTTYTMIATGCGGTAQQQVTVTVSQAPPPPSGADLAITDLRPQTPVGPVLGDITNHGPGTLTNVTVQLSCQWVVSDPIEGTQVDSGATGSMPISISNLSPGQTQAFNTDISVDPSYRYDVTCSVQVGFNDPNLGNNSYSESFP
ncbi:MAG: hypothetical protein CEE40_04695 [Chloroflexi bacterium B3_Chlor]|nr:MAG: hypothetical protein CEE40_04695 [Chloroflexi bacterium B3_Chlor]